MNRDSNVVTMATGEDVRLAAEAAADPDRTLPQENLATTHPAEARRWARTYSQLVHFKDRVLQAAYHRLARMTEPAARQEVVDTDLVLLEAENSRLRRRLQFWKRRQDKLSG